jgi:hypothetical protein
MTRREALKLVENSKGRICVRYIKRPDGKIATVDKPLYQLGSRVRIAAGVVAATLTVSAMAYSQGEPKRPESTKIEKNQKSVAETSDPILFKLSIVDVNGAVIPGATAALTNVETKVVLKAISNEDGEAIFYVNDGGKFRLEVLPVAGFKKLILDDILVNKHLEMKVTQESIGRNNNNGNLRLRRLFERCDLRKRL